MAILVKRIRLPFPPFVASTYERYTDLRPDNFRFWTWNRFSRSRRCAGR
ncbi:hypothetical protein Esi_0014_0070 [Ectocarpus siliculosus]|uniref:Uncharacterized protein n=1 Tax=Ectocarpus siliculosus TaxID=2880 RepID=D8LEV3_ECTSI|nr:hypothetical protein Esi_0014_0070 [Ectocarpus siliculosus]|eukprot:CBN79773.1 hypothetical protein Esi_0014_0070 [Ectocarpus siliculosus]